MRFIIFWDFNPEDIDKVIAKNMQMGEIMEKEPDRFGKFLFPPQTTTYTEGFSLVDSTPEQIRNAEVFWFPELKMQYVPCSDVSEWIQEYMKSK
jgi:hypothetical protein